jgi:hypothetical protein
MGKDFDDLAHRLLGWKKGALPESEVLEPFANRFCPQTSIAGQVLAIGWVWSGFEATENGCYLPITIATAGLVGHRQWGIDGYQSGDTGA